MSKKCETCPESSFGSRDPFSYICDGCTSDPNVGWGGSVDHSKDPPEDVE